MKKNNKKLEFPPQKTYFVASMVLINEEGQLLLTKEKNNRNIWTVPGGEVDYKAKEQFLDAAIRETKEEVDVSVDPREAQLIDVRISYAEGDNPYKKHNIFILIATCIAHFSPKQKITLKRSFDALERKYDVKDFIWIAPEEISKKKIKVHKNFIKTIPIINQWIEKYGKG
ncbi:MAG: NUDIX hydrolase [bacterium]|nr:NUDIX hydrolase [bacterium]